MRGLHEAEVSLPKTGASTLARLEPGVESRRPSKDGRCGYFFRGWLLSRLPPEGFPGFFDGMPPPLLFEPPELLPPLFLLLLFLDIVLESFVGWPR